MVSMIAGGILIVGLCRSFRQYKFTFPWLWIAEFLLSLWVLVQPAYLVRSFENLAVAHVVSTAGIVVFVMSAMTLLLAWIHSIVASIPLETLWGDAEGPSDRDGDVLPVVFLDEPLDRGPERGHPVADGKMPTRNADAADSAGPLTPPVEPKTAVVLPVRTEPDGPREPLDLGGLDGQKRFAIRGEEWLNTHCAAIRAKYRHSGYIAVDSANGDVVFAADESELADAVAMAQNRHGHNHPYYARNLAKKFASEG